MQARAPFTVTPTTTTTTTATTTTTTTQPHGTTTTTQPHSGGSTTTSTTSTTSTTTTTVPPPGEAPPGSPTQALRLDRLAIPPGGPVTANGYGCNPDATVVLTMASRQVGETTAAADGTFATPLDVGTFAVGRYAVVAQCGPLLTTSLDIVLATQVGQPTATFAIIIFFLLIGLAIFRHRIRLDTAPTSARIEDDELPEEPDATP